MTTILAAARTLPFHSIGGMQAITWDLLRAFAAAGHRTSVLTTRLPDGPHDTFVRDGVEVIPLPETTPEKCNGAWHRAARRYAEQMRSPPDVLFSVSSAGASLLPLRSKWPSTRFFWQAHGTAWGELLAKWHSGRPLEWIKSARNGFNFLKDATYYPRFDGIVLVGDVLERHFASAPTRWIAQNVPLITIRNGVDSAQFAPDAAARTSTRNQLGYGPTHEVVLFAARMHFQKGPRVAIEAFSRLYARRPSARLLMVGSGDALADMKALAQARDLGEVIQFMGGIAREDMTSLLNAGDTFLFPTLCREGLPMSVLEALACGLPVASSQSMRPVFSTDLDIDYFDPSILDNVVAAVEVCLDKGWNSTSRLTPAYTLNTCVSNYLRMFNGEVAGA